MATLDEILRWNADSLSVAASDMANSSSQSLAFARSVSASMPSGWSGPAADAARAAVMTTQSAITKLAQIYTGMSRALEVGGSEIKAAQEDIRTAQSRIEQLNSEIPPQFSGRRFSLSDDGGFNGGGLARIALSLLPTLSDEDAAAKRRFEELESQAIEASRKSREAVQRANQIDETLASQLANASGTNVMALSVGGVLRRFFGEPLHSGSGRTWTGPDPRTTALTPEDLENYTRWYFQPARALQTAAFASHDEQFAAAQQFAGPAGLTLADGKPTADHLLAAKSSEEAVRIFNEYSQPNHHFSVSIDSFEDMEYASTPLLPGSDSKLATRLAALATALSFTPRESPMNTQDRTLHVRSALIRKHDNFRAGGFADGNQLALTLDNLDRRTLAHEQAHTFQSMKTGDRVFDLTQTNASLKDLMKDDVYDENPAHQAERIKRARAGEFATPYAATNRSEDWAETVRPYFSELAPNQDPTTPAAQKAALALSSLDEIRPGLGRYLVVANEIQQLGPAEVPTPHTTSTPTAVDMRPYLNSKNTTNGPVH